MQIDTKSLLIVLHLTLICEDKNILYVFVEFQKFLVRDYSVIIITASILSKDLDDLQSILEILKLILNNFSYKMII